MRIGRRGFFATFFGTLPLHKAPPTSYAELEDTYRFCAGVGEEPPLDVVNVSERFPARPILPDDLFVDTPFPGYSAGVNPSSEGHARYLRFRHGG